MARTTPGTGIPVPESPDPRTITADLWASFSKVGQLITQTSGESSAALVTAEQAETAAAQALARALLIEDPIHVGPSEPTEGEELWVDTDEDAPPTPVSVSSEDITDATEVGRNVLTAPLSVDARNALSIFTGSRALLDAGTDTEERTWDAKELHEYVTETAAEAGGAASWDDLTGKPATYPPSTHTHEITDVDGLQAIIDRLTVGTGWRDIGALGDGLNGPEVTIGRSNIIRTGPWVTLRGWTRTTGELLSVILYQQASLPGFTLAGNYNLPGGSVAGGTAFVGTAVTSSEMRVTPGSGATGTTMRFNVTWRTDEPWPTTLPGTPA